MNPSKKLGLGVTAVTLAVACLTTLHAQSVSPVPAPTIITTAPYTITTAGYYQLGANLNYAGTGATNEAIITVNASNVTLDFAGHFIAGPASSPTTQLYGVYANERSNLVVENGTVAYCFYGIKIEGNHSATTNNLNPRILNMTATKCYFVGASIQYAVISEISGSRFSSIGGSTVLAGGYGIEDYAGSGGKVLNNTIADVTSTSSPCYGIECFSGTAFVANNLVTNVSGPANNYGINGGGAAVGNTITNCTTGITGVAKYANNLTVGCTTPFSGGTAVGYNN